MILASLTLAAAAAPHCATAADTVRLMAPGAAAPPSLVAMPRCVWGKLKAVERSPLVAATEKGDAAGIESALTQIKADTLLQARACSKTIDHDASTGDAVLLAGLRQEAAGELLNRDLRITRAQLDAAIAREPGSLTIALRQAAEKMESKKPVGPLPAVDALVTGLKRSAGASPFTAHQLQWLQVYALGHFDVLQAADSYDPNPKL